MKGKKTSAVAASGAVALIFLILGFQIAIFSGNVFRFRQEAAEEAQARAGAFRADNGPQAEARTSSADREIDASDVTSSNGVSGDTATGSGEAESGKSPLRRALEAGSQRERDYGDSRTVLAERVTRRKTETPYLSLFRV